MRIVIATGFLGFLRHRQATEFPAPNDKCLIQQAALRQILQERGDRLVGFTGELRMVAGDVVVAVPASLVFHAPL